MDFKLFQVIVCLATLGACYGACTYTEVDLDLYDCFDSRGITTEYALPAMSSTYNAILFCSTYLSQIKTCVEGVIDACSSNSNVTKFFGDGTILSSAYTYLCTMFDANSNTEPFDCATSVDMGLVKGNLTAFDTAVDALSSPTKSEICKLADDFVDGFVAEVSTACSGSQLSIDIWTTYLSKVTKKCTSGATGGAVVSVILMLASLLAATSRL